MAVNYGELEVNTTLDGTIDGEIQEGAGEGTTNYNYLINKPSINDVELKGNKSLEDLGIATSLADLADDEEHRTVSDEEKTAWNNKSDFSGDYNDLRNKPDIPTKLSDLEEDSAHQTITNAERANWNQKADKNEVPDSLSDLDDDQYHRLVTDAEKTTWNNKPDEVSELDDVNITNLQDGQVLKYDSISGKFVNANESGGIANAYAKIKVADTLIEASGEDTIELVAGSNVTLTPDKTNKKVAISATGGGGTSTGDMLKEIYDTNNDGIVNAADKATTLDRLESSITELNYLKDATGNIQQQLNSKSEFSGSYNDLIDKPTIPDAQIQSDWNQSDNSKKDYIKNKPTIPDELADLSDDSTHRLVTDAEKTTWNNKSDFSGSYNDLTDKPTIPDELADLSDDSTHRLVTDTEKSTWDAKSDFSGSYNDLTDKPTIPDPQIQADWNQTDNTSADFIKNKPTIPSGQIQSDWNQTTSSEVDYIKNKPTLGTAASKDSTNAVTQNSTDLVESGAVWNAINNLPEPMVFKGTLGVNGTITTLPTASSSNEGYTYKVITDGTYDGKSAKVGDLFTSNATEWVLIPSGDETFTDTWRSIKVNDTELLGSSIASGAVNFKSGSNVTISGSGNDITINAQDTTYSKATAQADGLMSKEDFSKLSDIETGAQVNTITGVKGNAESEYRTGNVNITPTNIGLGNVDNTSDATKKTNFTGSIASGNTNFVTGGDAYTALGNKVDKVDGKGLSTNDYTTTEKNKLAGIATNATKVESSTTNGNIKINGAETQVYDDSDIQDVITEDTTTVTGNPLSFNTLSVQRASQTEILLNPIQDLHGFDKPWIGGAGKNKLPITVASVKAGNTSGTWSGNVYTLNNVTFTLLTDSDGNLVGIKTNGTASAQTRLLLTFELSANSYTITGTPSTGSSTTYRQIIYNNTTASYIAYDNNAGATFTLNANSSLSYIIQILQGVNPNNAIFYPMIRLSSETDVTYAPYTNYASISGRTKIGLLGCGVNIWDEEWEVGSYDITTGAKSTDNTRIRNKNKIPIKSNTAYCFSTQTSRIPTILWYDKYENFISITSNSASSAFVTTSPTNAQYACFFGTTTYGTTYNNNICVNISDSSFDGQYIPHISSNDITISFGTTVYSGTLNVLKGELVVDYGMVDLSTLEDWYYWSSGAMFNATLDGYLRNSSVKAVCEGYNFVGGVTGATDPKLINGSCGLLADSSTIMRLYIKNLAYTNTTDLITSLSGMKFVYELATPITIQLTPYQVSLLKDANYITTTGDSITLTYRDGTMATLGDLVNIPTKLSELYNDNDTVMDADYVHTDNNYTDTEKGEVALIPELSGIVNADTNTLTGNPLNFSTKFAQNAESTVVGISPIQNLHGYSRPWVGGAGKNKLFTNIANIKSVNTGGTWSGNVYTYDNMTYTVLTDDDNNITGIKVNGSNGLSGDMNFFITNRSTGTAFYLPTNTYNLNGCPANGSDSTYQMRFQCTRDGSLHSFGVDNGNGLSNASVLNTDRLQVVINIKSGVSVSNKIFYPMIYLSTETDASFASYANLCPITGRSEIGILGCGKNILPFDVADLKTKNTAGTWSGNTYTYAGVTYALNDDNTITAGRASASSSWAIFNFGSYTLQAGTYTVSSGLASNDVMITVRKNNTSGSIIVQTTDGDASFTLSTESVVNFTLGFRPTYAGTNILVKPMVYQGGEASNFVPYTVSNDITISFGRTIYGGTLDVENGVLRAEEIKKTLTGDDVGFAYISNLSEVGWTLTEDYFKVGSTAISDRYAFRQITGWNQLQNGEWSFHPTNHDYLRVKDDSLTSSSVAQTYFNNNPLQVAYELETPITIQLTPHQISLLKGINNISSDANTISLTYKDGILTVVEPATEESDGIMSATDKKTLDSISDFSTSTVEGNPVSFITDNKQIAKHSVIDIAPVQDLHGYNKPWTGGVGKNLCPMTVSDIKSINTSGTWSGNICTYNQVAYTILTDADGNVTGINVNGTATGGNSSFLLTRTLTLTDGTSYILNGCPSGGSGSSYNISVGSYGSDTGSGKSFTYDASASDKTVRIWVVLGTNVSNKVFYPMIRLSTESDASFAPYTNIASISGRTEVDLVGCGKNLWNGKFVNTAFSVEYNSWNTNLCAGNLAMPIKVGTQYTFSINGTATTIRYAFLDANKDLVTNLTNATTTVSAPLNAVYLRWRQYDIPIAEPTLCQLEEGSSATPYELYTKSNDLTITFGQTIYGGTLDIEKGLLTINKGYMEFDGSSDEEWTRGNTSTSSDTKYRMIYSNLSPSADNTKSAISNQFRYLTAQQVYTRNVGFAISNDNQVFVYEPNLTQDVDDWKTYLASNPLQVCYELATPITIQLPPNTISLLERVNNISIDDNYSTITLTYRNGEVVTLGDLQDQSECHVYSTEEKVVAKWIDGRPVYEKVVFFGEIPNGVSKEVAHNIDNFYTAITISGVGRNSSTGEVNFAQQRDGASIWMTPTSIGTWGTRSWDGIDFYFYITYIKDE